MPKYTLTICGILIALLPFSGFPGSFKAPAYFILGALVAYLGFEANRFKRKASSFRRHRKPKEAISIKVNGTESAILKEEPHVITSLIEPDEEHTAQA
jgi:hypothetical protein